LRYKSEYIILYIMFKWVDLSYTFFRISVWSVPDSLYLFYALYFNIFHKKLAIWWFDWNFSPNHNSSHIIATMTGSIFFLFIYFNLVIIRSPSFESTIKYFFSFSFCFFILAFYYKSLTPHTKGKLLNPPFWGGIL